MPLPGALAYVPAIVAALGCAVALRSSPRRSLGLIGFFLCASLGSVLYFNLPEHWFRTLDRHYLPSLVLLTPFMATGGAASLRLAIGARGLAGPALAIGLGGLLAIAPIRSWAVNRRACDLARVRYAETFGRNLLEPLERDAILLTNGDNDTFPLWYLQEVEGARRDVTVINLPTANLGWWIAQLRRGDPRYARLLEGERGMDVLEPVRLPDSTVTLPVALDAPLGIRQPASRPAAVTFSISGRLYGDDRVVLDLLRIERWRRPLYIACTVTRDQVPWFWPYARLDGLAFRVVPSADPTAWDVDHARRQLTEKMTYAGLADSTVAMDQDSQLMSRNYLASFIQVALAQIDRGDAHGCLDTLAFLEAHVPLARLGAPADLVDGLRARAEAELSSTRQP